jgi:hypothetical protein
MSDSRGDAGERRDLQVEPTETTSTPAASEGTSVLLRRVVTVVSRSQAGVSITWWTLQNTTGG